MQISNRFAIGVHVLLCVAKFAGEYKTTSDFLAGSVGVNPVVIRRILSSLKKAGLVSVQAGSGGSSLAREPERISLLDVYQAVDVVEPKQMFHLHGKPNPACPVGGSIHKILNGRIVDAQGALEASLAKTWLSDLLLEV